MPDYVATIFAHDKYDTRPIYAVKACAKFVRWPDLFDDQKICLMTRKWNTTKWNLDHAGNVHYSDVIMSAMASQITGVLIVCLKVCSVADQRKHQSSLSLAFARGIHRWQVNTPHKGLVTRKMFPFDDVIMEWKSSGEMGPRTLRQPNLRKVDLPYRGKAEMKAL